MSAERIITEMLAKAGITVGGSDPWDIAVHDKRVFARILSHGALGLGESYMAGWWDTSDLFGFFQRLIRWRAASPPKPTAGLMLAALKAKLGNRQSIAQTRELANTHYNLSNKMFRAMLGETMVYSCATWANDDNGDDNGGDDLTAAQNRKLDLICRKLGLKAGDRLLDIGCGWGSLAEHAAKKYGCKVTGITIASEQAKLARQRCDGLPVEIIETDYREHGNYSAGGDFDAIASVGMAEHVGAKNYRAYLEAAERALKNDGLFLLHTIGAHKPRTTTRTSWFEKYIFPGGQQPALSQLNSAAEGLFLTEDLHNIGYDYAPTLLAWFDNFDRYWQQADPATAVENFDGDPNTFYRMWKFYLLSAAASFSVRKTSVWQIVLAKKGVPGGYRTVR